jgi:hypothetical protein
MSKKKSVKRKRKQRLLDLHLYGIFDLKKNTMLKISLDKEDLQMDFALMGGPSEHLAECEFDIKVAI